MSRTYAPDVWVVLKIQSKEFPTVYKILAGWYGGFAGSNSWKLSSGITSIHKDGEGYTHFLNHSGSTYICHPNSYRLSGLTSSILATWQKQLKGSESSMELMDSTFDVSKVL